MEEYAAEKSMKRDMKKAVIVISVFIVLVVIGIIYPTVIIPKLKYNKAVELMSAGEFAEAYDIFLELKDYKDSAEKARVSAIESYKSTLKGYQVGDIITIGSYEQDNDASNGKENIEWIVLAKDGEKLLIISKHALDCRKYNETRTDVTWETCSLRTWLNGTFFDEAFSSTQQEIIAATKVTADKNVKYGTDPGNDTTDNIFLLSIPEAAKYFSSETARAAIATKYAVAQGAYQGSNGNSVWWLRSPGRYASVAAFVCNGGYVRSDGFVVIYSPATVRPALWIDLN